MCDHLEVLEKGGGQNKRARKSRGCPSGCSPKESLAHIHTLVHHQPSFDAEEVEYDPDRTINLLCQLCSGVLNQPVELACGNLVCANCCCRWIHLSGGLACPCCYEHQLDSLTVGLPSGVVYNLLGDIKLVCKACRQMTTAAQYGLHKESQCKGHYEISSPSRISAREILSRPVTAPTQPVEKKVAENLVRRLMAENEDMCGIVKIPTKGQVMAYKCISFIRLNNFSTLTLATESASSVYEQRLHF